MEDVRFELADTERWLSNLCRACGRVGSCPCVAGTNHSSPEFSIDTSTPRCAGRERTAGTDESPVSFFKMGSPRLTK